MTQLPGASRPSGASEDSGTNDYATVWPALKLLFPFPNTSFHNLCLWLPTELWGECSRVNTNNNKQQTTTNNKQQTTGFLKCHKFFSLTDKQFSNLRNSTNFLHTNIKMFITLEVFSFKTIIQLYDKLAKL